MLGQEGVDLLGPNIAIVLGYAMNAVGVVLMVRYGLPYSLPILGLIRKVLTEKEATRTTSATC